MLLLNGCIELQLITCPYLPTGQIIDAVLKHKKQQAYVRSGRGTVRDGLYHDVSPHGRPNIPLLRLIVQSI